MNSKILILLAGAILLLITPFAAPAGADTIDVDIASFAFDPSTLEIQVGDTVKWTNFDTASHTATSDTLVWDSGTLTTGDQFEFTFTEVGLFPYYCTIHPSMTAAIVVKATLTADTDTLSATTGGVVNFTLDAGAAFAGRSYVLLGTAAGTSPGTMLPGGGVLPLNQDFVFNYIRTHLASPMFTNFLGLLDSPAGQAAATLDTMGPVPAVLPVGSTLHFAYTTVGLFDFQSEAVAVEIVP